MFNTAKDLTTLDVERVLHHMVIEEILAEDFEVQQPYGTVIAYLRVMRSTPPPPLPLSFSL